MEENRTIVRDECMVEARMPCLHGLHLRSSVNLVKLAQGFSSEVRLRRGRCEADAKSILNVLAMGRRPGTLAESVLQAAARATVPVLTEREV